MKTLLIDNYDSFTFNLYQLLGQVNGAPPEVVCHDEIDLAEILARGYDGIVISPGPGSVVNAADFGVCRDVVLQDRVPVLGVCLGHQGLCYHYGGKIDYAPEPMHGRLSEVHHRGCDILEGIPSPFSVVRYHSLVARDLPECLEAIAWTSDGVLMGVRHRERPMWGVQFHPESISTEHGRRLLENFRDLALRRATRCTPTLPAANGHAPLVHTAANEAPRMTVRYRQLARFPDPEAAFVRLFGAAQPAFWLDSSLVEPGRARYSFMGACTPQAGEHLSYDVQLQQLRIARRGLITTRRQPVLDYLSGRLDDHRVDGEALPFPFAGGYVGYLGYELKADCGASTLYQHRSTTPDAMLLLAERFLAFDHLERRAYLVCVEDRDSRAGEAWMDRCQGRLEALPPLAPWTAVQRRAPLEVALRHEPGEYLTRIDECLREIREGNSYEVCLTNQMRVVGRADPLQCYRALRSINPAPYAAFLRFPGVDVMSASPERFLTIDRQRWVESKPIKGTAPRGETPLEDEALRACLAGSEKNRAENLMIVDLLRNDLGAVCRLGSVHVPKLFGVESFATVHQLVSTVRGQLRPEADAVACVRAAFPGGSMTGAPKRRTMEIIDRLEDGPRGVYSGAIGYFGLDGAADLSIVIRTIVSAGGELSLGVGGAIVALSDPESELEETYVKARASLQALDLSVADPVSSARRRVRRATG
jgi:para-aminobenzoate synthetase